MQELKPGLNRVHQRKFGDFPAKEKVQQVTLADTPFIAIKSKTRRLFQC